MKNLKLDPKNWEWYAYLDASEEIKDKYKIASYELSNEWITCACGQVCEVLPKYISNAPKDGILFGLGVTFNNFIHENEFDEAKITLDEIEARTIFLLKQPNYIDPKTL